MPKVVNRVNKLTEKHGRGPIIVSEHVIDRDLMRANTRAEEIATSVRNHVEGKFPRSVVDVIVGTGRTVNRIAITDKKSGEEAMKAIEAARTGGEERVVVQVTHRLTLGELNALKFIANETRGALAVPGGNAEANRGIVQGILKRKRIPKERRFTFDDAQHLLDARVLIAHGTNEPEGGYYYDVGHTGNTPDRRVMETQINKLFTRWSGKRW